MKRKLVILDTEPSAGGEPLYQQFSQLADCTCYPRTSCQQVTQRIADAQLVITNKCRLDRPVLQQCPKLEYIGVAATGYNNIDMAYVQERGITVTNAPGYAGEGVAQLTFAFILEAYNKVRAHDARVRQGEWRDCLDFCFYDNGLQELSGQTIGLIGWGDSARRVSRIAQAFGMNVLVYTRTVPADASDNSSICFADLDTLLGTSDIVSVHCPLTDQTRGMFDVQQFQKMRRDAIFINTSRGPIVNEAALADALKDGQIAAAYTDVLSAEPPLDTNPLLHTQNMIITPHIAWAAKQTRARLIDLVYRNLQAYLNDNPINVVSCNADSSRTDTTNRL